MKKFALLLITMLFTTVASAQPMRFAEGTHYEVISQKASDTPNVTEYFSFYCPHCYNFEFIAKGLEKNLPDGVKFKKSHVDFMRSASPQTQQMLSRAMLVGDKMGAGHQVTEAIFKHIHKDRKPFTSEEDVLQIFTAVGLDANKAKEMLNSFGIKNMANKMKQDQNELSKARVLQSVPMLIVNGKYKVLPTKLRSMDDYQALVDYLLTMK